MPVHPFNGESKPGDLTADPGWSLAGLDLASLNSIAVYP
jgi:hypothetical protein